jgi:hypothetical protein
MVNRVNEVSKMAPDQLDEMLSAAKLAGDAAIVTAIARVQGADLYVQKRGKNQFHGYKYATIGDLLDKLQPLMAEAGLVIFQHEMASDFIDNGNVMVTRYQFTLAHTSGAVWPEKPIHTGMSGCRNSKGGFDDKAANKCHTAARKYFLLGLFQVPTGEDYRQPAHDGDADSAPDVPPGEAPPAEHVNGNGHANGHGKISAEQKETLIGLIKETGSDTKRFLDYLGVPNLDELPTSKFAVARAALERKRNAKKEPA